MRPRQHAPTWTLKKCPPGGRRGCAPTHTKRRGDALEEREARDQGKGPLHIGRRRLLSDPGDFRWQEGHARAVRGLRDCRQRHSNHSQEPARAVPQVRVASVVLPCCVSELELASSRALPLPAILQIFWTRFDVVTHVCTLRTCPTRQLRRFRFHGHRSVRRAVHRR